MLNEKSGFMWSQHSNNLFGVQCRHCTAETKNNNAMDNYTKKAANIPQKFLPWSFVALTFLSRDVES